MKATSAELGNNLIVLSDSAGRVGFWGRGGLMVRTVALHLWGLGLRNATSALRGRSWQTGGKHCA